MVDVTQITLIKNYDDAIRDCTNAIQVQFSAFYYIRAAAYKAKGDFVKEQADRQKIKESSGK